MMGKCKQHPLYDIPGDGVCPSCLQKKLTSVWRGESYSEVQTSSSIATHQSNAEPVHPKEAIAIIGSIASITKRTHANVPSRKPHPSFDVRDGATRGDAAAASVSGPKAAPRKQDIKIDGVMKDWTELQTKRRSKAPIVVESKSRSSTFSGGRSLPLVDRTAKEIALRVIREVGDEDDKSVEGIEGFRSGNRRQNGDSLRQDVLLQSIKHQEKVTGFSRIRSKWVKGLGSPMTASNKIFPSKSVENVQKSLAQHSPAREDSRIKPTRDLNRGRILTYNVERTSSQAKAKSGYDDLNSGTVIEGMPDQILKPEDMNQRLQTSHTTVLLWLQDLPCPPTPLLQKTGDPEDLSPSSFFGMEIRNNDCHPEDLTLVGHLHEIAEENENFQESIEEEEISINHLSEVSSFGKFLIRAAQRQPKEGLSRVARATPTR